MSEQASGGYRCNVCGMTFNSLSDLDAHTKEVITQIQQLHDSKNSSISFLLNHLWKYTYTIYNSDTIRTGIEKK